MNCLTLAPWLAAKAQLGKKSLLKILNMHNLLTMKRWEKENKQKSDLTIEL